MSTGSQHEHLVRIFEGVLIAVIAALIIGIGGAALRSNPGSNYESPTPRAAATTAAAAETHTNSPTTPAAQSQPPTSSTPESVIESEASGPTQSPPVLMAALGVVDDGPVSDWRFQDVTEIKGQLYDSTLWTCADLKYGNSTNCAHSTATTWAEIGLSGRYRTFTANLAFGDKSASDCMARAVILRDGFPDSPIDLEFDTVVPVSLDVSGVQRLRFEVNFLQSGMCYLTYAGATLYP